MASNIELALPILFLCLLALIHEKIVENQNYVIENFHSSWWPSVFTLPTAEILNGKNARAFLVCGFLMKSIRKKSWKYEKKLWEPFGSYLLNSTANPAQFEWKWAGLAVLFGRQILNRLLESKILVVRTLGKLSR